MGRIEAKTGDPGVIDGRRKLFGRLPIHGDVRLTVSRGKEIADEDIDGFDVQFQIGPLQGPLPAVPEEGRRRGAVQFRGYFSSLLGTFEAARENILPLREDGGKLLAEVFRQGVDLLRQLSGQTTGTAIGPRHLVPHFADEGPEAAQRGQGRVREATLQLLRDEVPVAVYEFRAEPFLCLEIVVERTPRNTRALQYLVDPHCGIAFFRQHFRPDVDQHFPGQQFVAALLGRAATAFGVLRVILHG